MKINVALPIQSLIIIGDELLPQVRRDTILDPSPEHAGSLLVRFFQGLARISKGVAFFNLALVVITPSATPALSSSLRF
jgi:hypothetical protein